MKYKIALITLTSLFFSNIFSMHQMDEAINTCNVGSVKRIISRNKFDSKQKQKLIDASNSLVSDWQRTSKSLLRSHKDMLRLLFGLGTNGSGCGIILFGLLVGAVGLGFDKQPRLNPKTLIASLGILGVGGLTWLVGLYNTVKGWKLSNAYSKLSNARQIQEMIEDIIPVNEQIRKK